MASKFIVFARELLTRRLSGECFCQWPCYLKRCVKSFFRERVNAFDNPEKAMEDFVARQKMKRLGSAEEIAGAVSFLASKDVNEV